MKQITLIAVILALASCSGRVYVSSSSGDDSCDGRCPSSAVKTIERALQLGNDIRLRTGDWFFEAIRADSVKITSWGSAKDGKPVLCGFMKVPAGMKGPDGGSIWQRGEFDGAGTWGPSPQGNIYRLEISLLKDGFCSTSSDMTGNIGTIYDPATDTMYGRKCQAQTKEISDTLSYKAPPSYRYPVKDLDFYQSWTDYRYIYVLAGDPSLLTGRELWLSAGSNCIRGHSKTVKGIKVLGWGFHGAGVTHDVTIEDCDFDIIGGSFLKGYDHWVRYGNGTEFWATSSYNSLVCNCTYSRVYDTGTTIQGDHCSSDRCENVIFRNNTFRGCRQDFEVWIRSADGSMPKDCAFIDNIGYDSGDNGFDSTEENNTHLLHYVVSKYPISGIKVENNEFFGGEGLYYSQVHSNMPTGRTVYHCAPGAPVIKHHRFVLTAPEKNSDGTYKYISAMDSDYQLEWKNAATLQEALRGFDELLVKVTGNAEIELVIE